MSEKMESTAPSISLPVKVEADNVHRRYCAFLVLDGIPYSKVYGSYSSEGSSDADDLRNLAIQDLQRKITDILKEQLKKSDQ